MNTQRPCTFRRFGSLLLTVAMLTTLGTAGCQSTGTVSTSDDGSSTVSAASKPQANATTDATIPVGSQMELPAAGEEIAVLHTSMGDIRIRLFPDGAPKTVENFKGLIRKGYYNGLIFHRVISNFMIQGGDPLGTGTGGESLWGGKFEDEFNPGLLNIRGSLAMANSGPNTNGSQFFINQGGPGTFGGRDAYNYDTMMANYQNYYNQYLAAYGDNFKQTYPTVEDFVNANGGLAPDSRLVPDEVWDLYEHQGGNIHLDGAWRSTGGHSVFGQVFDGMDVVDAIAGVETDSSNKPLNDVVIESAEIVIYQP